VPEAKPKIRHLAIFVRDTDKVAKFYQKVFDMELVGSKGPGNSQYLSDGYLTLAILPHSTEGSVPTGLNHFGFSVTDRAEITQRMVSEGVGQPTARPADRAYAEFRGCDPEGNMFDLSESFEETRRPDLVHKGTTVNA
jgi:catechol 2,3-dioxygenase-like lactoylglutathione lyase family enzyme